MSRKSELPLYTGGCQCGAVRFRTSQLLDNAHVCFCRMCQRASGGMAMGWVGVANPALTWTKGLPNTFSSSEGVGRGFCRECGTTLYFSRASRSYQFLALAAFDDPHDIEIRFTWGNESKLDQLAQCAEVPAHNSIEDTASFERARLTNRQFKIKR